MTDRSQLLPAEKFSDLTDEETEALFRREFGKFLLEMYESGEVFPAKVVDRLLGDKDKQIAELQDRLLRLGQLAPPLSIASDAKASYGTGADAPEDTKK